MATPATFIEAFGNFVVRGNYVVGLVIFLILVLINFIVITKGAGRIAEVAARFTLDAMPGKQMAIDAELMPESSMKPRRAHGVARWNRKLTFMGRWTAPANSSAAMPLPPF